jgi:RNA polymerase sigma-70 factor (ECF subfamily)
MARQETTLLLDRARAGEREAMDRLLQRASAKLLALIRLRMGRGLRARLESRDILQATLVKAWGRLDQLQDPDRRALMAWLARIAENEIRDQADFHGRLRRDADRDASLPEAAAVPSPVRSALSQVIWNERAERVEQAMESLSEAHREIIVLRKLEELGFREIGERLGKSEDACRMLYGRAMAALTLALPEER